MHVNYFGFMPFCIGWVEYFDEIALSCTVKEMKANFCFSIFVKNFGEEENFFLNCHEYISQLPCGSKMLTKSLYLARLRR